MRVKNITILILLVLLFAGCGKKDEDTANTVSSEPAETVVASDDLTEADIDDSSSMESLEDPSSGYSVNDPSDFQIDTVQITAEEQMQELLRNNTDYIESKGLTVESLVNATWDYRESDDLYSFVAYDGSKFHAVVVSVTDNTIVIDPE